jgi:bifunctional non-homologous end joining protein LigD
MTAPALDVETLELDGREVRITSPSRILWPATGTTKRDLVAYLVRAAPAILPQLQDRGLTMRRFPEGVDARGWFQAQCRGRPAWMRTFDVHGLAGDELRYCVADDAAGLAWLGGQSCIELHPFLGTVDRPLEPTAFVVDLDPAPPLGLLDAAAVALRVRDRLGALGLPAVAKVSGVRGIHVLVPLRAGHGFEHTKAAARVLGDSLARADPWLVTARLGRRAAREGRVLVDWLQNDPTRSTVAAWSPRAAPVPLVSVPVAWDEIERAIRDGRVRDLRFGFEAALTRIESGPSVPRAVPDPALAVELPPPDAFA